MCIEIDKGGWLGGWHHAILLLAFGSYSIFFKKKSTLCLPPCFSFLVLIFFFFLIDVTWRNESSKMWWGHTDLYVQLLETFQFKEFCCKLIFKENMSKLISLCLSPKSFNWKWIYLKVTLSLDGIVQVNFFLGVFILRLFYPKATLPWVCMKISLEGPFRDK